MVKRCHHRRGERRARRARRVQRKKQKKRPQAPQTGGLYSVYENLRMAAKHAKTLPKDNLFRRVTVNRYGIPRAMQKKMYYYN